MNKTVDTDDDDALCGDAYDPAAGVYGILIKIENDEGK